MDGREDMLRVVQAGYETIAETYHADRVVRTDANVMWLDDLRPLMPADGQVLDLGCGGGCPIAKYFADRGYSVRGIDVSPAMIQLARQAVPAASFEVADMSDFEIADMSADIVVCLFALFHLPRNEHEAMLRKMRAWLRPGGVLLISFGIDDEEMVHHAKWRDVEMAWSMHDQERYRAALDRLAFEIRCDDVETFNDQRHWWVLAGR